MRTAILLTAYGSRHPRAQASFEYIERQVAGLFPGIEVRWCFTSKNVRRLREADSPAEALERLREEGFEAVCVQSLHIIPGAEYEEMLAATACAAGFFTRLETGLPLLAGAGDTARVAHALLRLLPDSFAERPAGCCAVFLGHGTSHPGNVHYDALARELASLNPRAFLGTLEAGPDASTVRNALLAAGCREAFLVPFFFTAGVHVANDMLGDGPESWTSVLVDAGIQARPIVRGAGECDCLVAIWMDHLADAMARLGI
ncbi:cobalamin biosynthesis protein CbiK, Co2+ chelatase [Desulfocurvibacter africanus PCS]|uniref:Cobalamin biosynthesis protein CbiK, Co2+ chelatase n=1 Tax=Desulfocurvibacter africanus PCS TaxID=1262666 RepID=M5PTF4_DESAF|nr:sirohydrochlorin cobaltochelatase [Desulfocurvibacter africanus]EMG37632.1 cobalamin biosynthesis protein CbiK, Co2+ chelatase [Desulfocurvibacter africanus PCS]